MEEVTNGTCAFTMHCAMYFVYGAPTTVICPLHRLSNISSHTSFNVVERRSSAIRFLHIGDLPHPWVPKCYGSTGFGIIIGDRHSPSSTRWTGASTRSAQHTSVPKCVTRAMPSRRPPFISIIPFYLTIHVENGVSTPWRCRCKRKHNCCTIIGG